MALNVDATCAECERHVRLTGRDITCLASPGGMTGTYEFTCPHCGQHSSKYMGPEVCRLLKLAVGVTWVYPPAELDEIRLDAPPLTEDDLLAFAIDLYGSPDDYIIARAVL